MSEEKTPHLRRELGFRDLTLLLIIAVVNINTIPLIAGQGWRAISFWILAFFLFLVPQAFSVAEFGSKYPGEGGIYLWTRETFGDFHAFISGWCYWTNNLFYFPSILFILMGVLAYAGGQSNSSLVGETSYVGIGSLAFLWSITLLHIRGLRIGKWISNLGAVGTWLGIALMLAVGFIVISRKGVPATPFHPRSLLPSLHLEGLSAFSVTLYSLVGLELGSVMGDEIIDTRKIIRRAALIAGGVSILLYLLGTISLLVAVPSDQIGAVQGLMQAVSIVASDFHFDSLVPFVSLLLGLAVVGVCSAWISGAARIPFVMGLGRTHPKYQTPHIALIVQAIFSSAFIFISLYGSFVREAYETLLLSSVVLQLIPFLYLFLGLWKLKTKRLLAVLGLVATIFGIVFSFMPSSSVQNVKRFEIEVFGACAFMLGVAVVVYKFRSARVKAL
jgi:glutamate:GABA antiporter